MEKLVATALALALVLPQAVDHAAQLARGRALTQWSSPETAKVLYAEAGPALKAAIDQGGGPEAFSKSVAALGAETKVFDENLITLNGVTVYTRLSAFEKLPAAISGLGWTADGVIVQGGLRPSIPPLPEGDPKVETSLSLPLAKPRQGDWAVAWGGRNTAVNYHVTVPFQRYAYDLWVVRDDRTYVGDAQKNESYFCFGEPILAPAAGKVVSVVDGIADNVPVGAMNANQLAGNHVIIEHRPGEFSMLGHLKNGSTAVKPGDQVQTGTRVGLCGNSGNSSEPHLHFHLQNAGEFSMAAQGLPAVFRSLTVDGRRVQNTVPIRGQRIAP